MLTKQLIQLASVGLLFTSLAVSACSTEAPERAPFKRSIGGGTASGDGSVKSRPEKPKGPGDTTTSIPVEPAGPAEPVVTNDPIVKDPVVKDPVVKDPIVKDPIVKDPVVKDPVIPNPMAPNTLDVSVVELSVKNDKGGAPLKGDNVVLNLMLKNAGAKSGKVKITPYLTSKRFTDFTNVKLATQEVTVAGSESKVFPLKIENFFQDLGGSKKEYALNRGDYTVTFDIEPEGVAKKTAKDFKGNAFLVDKSNVVFTAVYWHQSYFDKVKFTGGVMKWMTDTFTRKGEINNGTSTVKASPKGFDEMMGVKTVFKTFEGFRLDRNKDFSGSGVLHQVSDWGKQRLGLKNRFVGTDCNSFTHPDNHGFDMEIGLSNDGFGGLAWVCGNTQASGVFDGDPSIGRSQMVLIHETGHNFGAPHCDPIQGFIMCSGEKHQKYAQDGSFVWHTVSIEKMKKKEQATIRGVNYSEVPDGTLSLTADVEGAMSEPELAVCDHE